MKNKYVIVNKFNDKFNFLNNYVFNIYISINLI